MSSVAPAVQVRRRAARLAARARWQPDKWERLTRVAALVGEGPRSILDVGGRAREMSFLLRSANVISVNVEPPADVISDPGADLPFPSRSFDCVTSTDVIEHVDADLRPGHIAELLRVARDRVVICCPAGSPEKDAAERRLADRLRADLGLRLPFLEEHLAYGLPREGDLRGMVAAGSPQARITCTYQEGIARGDSILLDGLRAKTCKDPRALVRFVQKAYLVPGPRLATAPSTDTSRFFMVIDL